MSTPITKYVQDATLLYLGHAAKGFNASLAVVTASYGIQPITIDWTESSLQFYPAYGTPDDLDKSTASKYPMVFLHGVRSRNTHESMSRNFSGQVEMVLAIWLTHKAVSFGKAGRALDLMCSAVEQACNDMFRDGNWPQGYGATNAVCMPPACTRTRAEPEGEGWRQAVIFNMVFTLDTN